MHVCVFIYRLQKKNYIMHSTRTETFILDAINQCPALVYTTLKNLKYIFHWRFKMKFSKIKMISKHHYKKTHSLFSKWNTWLCSRYSIRPLHNASVYPVNALKGLKCKSFTHSSPRGAPGGHTAEEAAGSYWWRR